VRQSKPTNYPGRTRCLSLPPLLPSYIIRFQNTLKILARDLLQLRMCDDPRLILLHTHHKHLRNITRRNPSRLTLLTRLRSCTLSLISIKSAHSCSYHHLSSRTNPSTVRYKSIDPTVDKPYMVMYPMEDLLHPRRRIQENQSPQRHASSRRPHLRPCRHRRAVLPAHPDLRPQRALRGPAQYAQSRLRASSRPLTSLTRSSTIGIVRNT